MIDFDVIIIGTGSGNTILTPEFDDLQIAIVEKGTFGGTCLNRGCIKHDGFGNPAVQICTSYLRYRYMLSTAQHDSARKATVAPCLLLEHFRQKSDRKNGKMEMGSTRQIWHPYVSVPTRIHPNPSRLTFQICMDPYGRLL